MVRLTRMNAKNVMRAKEGSRLGMGEDGVGIRMLGES
jgi:hypothetical protein